MFYLQQQISISALENKTQNINSTTNSNATVTNKPIYISSSETLRLYGTFSFISGWKSGTPNTRDWYIGTPSTNNKQCEL